MKTTKNLPKHQGWTPILMKTLLTAIVVGVVTIFSCSKEEMRPMTAESNLTGNNATSISELTDAKFSTDLITRRGMLQESGMTTYQYGTHVLTIPGLAVKYAVMSETINFDKYLNQMVEISGYPVEGYPMDGGPVLINVITIDRVTTELTSALGYLIAVPTNAIPYQYGWKYKLQNPLNNFNYYLKSSTINLEKYLNQFVKVSGEQVVYNYPPMSAAIGQESARSFEFGLTGINVSMLTPVENVRNQMQAPD